MGITNGQAVLRLVKSCDDLCATQKISKASTVFSKLVLEEKAKKIELKIGPNAYSKYIREHGSFPDRETSAILGRVVGFRVQASDGSLQPPLSPNEKAEIKARTKRRKDWANRHQDERSLRDAIQALYDASASKSKMLPFRTTLLTDGELRRKLLEVAESVQRFAEEMSLNEQTAHTENKIVHSQSDGELATQWDDH